MSYIECMVLGLLNQGRRYGHELDKVIEERHMRAWLKITRASMYQALARIKEKGWVNTSVEKIGNYPERTIYKLTDSGKKALNKMILDGLASDDFMEFHISVPISFIYTLPPQDAVIQLKKRKNSRVELLEKLPKDAENDDEKTLGERANIKLIVSYYKMELEWLEWLISELKQNAGKGDVSDEN